MRRVEWTTEEAAAVIKVIVNSWPGGIANRGWTLEQLEGFVGELQERGLQPRWAIVGLRESTSDFMPTAGKVRELAHAARPPMTALELQEAERDFRKRRGLPPLDDDVPALEEGEDEDEDTDG